MLIAVPILSMIYCMPLLLLLLSVGYVGGIIARIIAFDTKVCINERAFFTDEQMRKMLKVEDGKSLLK